MKIQLLLGIIVLTGSIFAQAQVPSQYNCTVITYLGEAGSPHSIKNNDKLVVYNNKSEIVDRYADESNQSYKSARLIVTVEKSDAGNIEINDELKGVSAIGKGKVALSDDSAKLAVSCAELSYTGK